MIATSQSLFALLCIVASVLEVIISIYRASSNAPSSHNELFCTELESKSSLKSESADVSSEKRKCKKRRKRASKKKDTPIPSKNVKAENKSKPSCSSSNDNHSNKPRRTVPRIPKENVSSRRQSKQPTPRISPPSTPHRQTSTPPPSHPSHRSRPTKTNPILAYKWFHTVRRTTLTHGRSDYVLGHGIRPLDVALLLILHWITVAECLDWADGRTNLGYGLVEFAAMRNRGEDVDVTVWNLIEDEEWDAVQPEEDELRGFVNGWVRLTARDIRHYDWKADADDLKQHGPLGPAFAKLASPDELTKILEQIADPDIDAESICLSEPLENVLDPLLAYKEDSEASAEDNELEPGEVLEEKKDPKVTGKPNAEGRAQDIAACSISGERDLVVNGPPKIEFDAAVAPPSTIDTDTAPLILTISSTISDPSSFPPTPESAHFSPLEPVSDLPPLQSSDASVPLAQASDAIETTSEESEMEDCSEPAEPNLSEGANLTGSNFDPFRSITIICCEENDVDMIPVEELTAVECDMGLEGGGGVGVMPIDAYDPEPSIWYPSSQPTIVAESSNATVDEEMQDVVPSPVHQPMKPLPRRAAIPRTSSIPVVDMQDALPEFPRPNAVPAPQLIPDIVISSPAPAPAPALPISSPQSPHLPVNQQPQSQDTQPRPRPQPQPTVQPQPPPKAESSQPQPTTTASTAPQSGPFIRRHRSNALTSRHPTEKKEVAKQTEPVPGLVPRTYQRSASVISRSPLSIVTTAPAADDTATSNSNSNSNSKPSVVVNHHAHQQSTSLNAIIPIVYEVDASLPDYESDGDDKENNINTALAGPSTITMIASSASTPASDPVLPVHEGEDTNLSEVDADGESESGSESESESDDNPPHSTVYEELELKPWQAKLLAQAKSSHADWPAVQAAQRRQAATTTTSTA